MQLTEDDIFQKYGKQCGYCNRNLLLPYEYEFTCFSCGYNVNKRKHEITKKHRKKIYQYVKRHRAKNRLYLRRCIKNI